MRNQDYRQQSGFALLENMVSLLLLSIGALGIALSTATAIKINVDNQQRAMALNAASTALESLYIAAYADDATGGVLRTEMAAFVPSEVEGSESVGLEVSSNPDEYGADRDTFIVKVLEAVNADGSDFLATSGYVSPVTVAVQVDYQGTGGRNIGGVEEVKTTYASYTFVLK